MSRHAKTPPLIRIERLDVRLADSLVLRGLDLSLAEPGLVALIGPNGAGKSTLLRTIAGLVRPERGTLTLDGRPLDTLTPEARAQTLAYLPQERTVAWPLSVRDIVGLGRAARHDPRHGPNADDAKAVEAALATMDVAAFADRSVLDLSGGERARVLMARALAQQPQVLLADEPAAGLDPAHQWTLFQHLAALADDGVCVIVAVHDLALAARFARHVVLMAQGRIAAAGLADRVLVPETLAGVYGITSVAVPVAGGRLVVPTGLVARSP
jgi:iron complex transport system ATP-binding protein